MTVLALGTLGRTLLDFVGHHPFLSIDQLAIALGRTVAIIRNSVDDAVAAGFMRTLDVEEARQNAGDPPLLELTTAGLELVAAQQGLSLAEAVRLNGLAGGGARSPVGSRQKLIAQLAHTRGVDTIFVWLIALARKRMADGSDDALLGWRNAASCARSRVRPDGYGLYRHEGHLYGFFLEYDRGTMGPRGYRAKLAAYCDYFENGRFVRDYAGFPTVLIVTTGPGSEARISRSLREVEVGRVSLPVLLTTLGRIDADRNGLLGPIWRIANVAAPRRTWLKPEEQRFDLVLPIGNRK